jgi:hypothetical protein
MIVSILQPLQIQQMLYIKNPTERDHGDTTIRCAAKNKCLNTHSKTTKIRKCELCGDYTHDDCFGTSAINFCLNCEDLHQRHYETTSTQDAENCHLDRKPIPKYNSEGNQKDKENNQSIESERRSPTCLRYRTMVCLMQQMQKQISRSPKREMVY